MADARFQVVSLRRPVPENTRPRPGRAAAPLRAADPARTSPRRFTWRFLAANNRSLASAPGHYPDAASCVAAIKELTEGLHAADAEFSRDDRGGWRWLIRVDGAVATSSHSYPRQARARTTCRTFFTLAADPAKADNVQVVYL